MCVCVYAYQTHTTANAGKHQVAYYSTRSTLVHTDAHTHDAGVIFALLSSLPRICVKYVRNKCLCVSVCMCTQHTPADTFRIRARSVARLGANTAKHAGARSGGRGGQTERARERETHRVCVTQTSRTAKTDHVHQRAQTRRSDEHRRCALALAAVVDDLLRELRCSK